MKSLLLASALLFAPIQNEEVEVEETPTQEVQEETQEETNFKEKISKLIEENEWLKEIVKTCGVVYGILGGGSFATLLIVVARAIHSSIKSKKIQKETLGSVKEAILNELKATIGEEVASQVEKPISDLTNSIVGVEQLQVVLGKIIALSQEDSYKSRLAILECISALNIVDNKIIENAQEDIKKEQKEEEKQKEQASENLDKVIEETEQEETNIIL